MKTKAFPIPDSQIRQIVRLLRARGISLAYLYGSFATGLTHAGSDVDIAVAGKRRLTPEIKLQKRLVLSAGLKKILGSDSQADVVFYEDLPVQVQYSALKESVLLFSDDEDLRVTLEHRTLSRYFDRLYYIRRHSQAVLHNVSVQGIL